MKTNETTKTDPRLFLVEFYTKGGEINFAWVGATDYPEARTKIATLKTFDEVIQTTEQHAVTKLGGNFRVNTPDANLHFIDVAAKFTGEA